MDRISLAIALLNFLAAVFGFVAWLQGMTQLPLFVINLVITMAMMRNLVLNWLFVRQLEPGTRMKSVHNEFRCRVLFTKHDQVTLIAPGSKRETIPASWLRKHVKIDGVEV